MKGNPCIFESDMALSKNLIALVRIPVEISNICEQTFKVFFHHSELFPTGRLRYTRTAEDSL
jgi:hypothetical protein